jgi:hypothetical protein
VNESFGVKLWINKTPIELNPFIEDFLAQVTIGVVKPLKGVDYIRNIELNHEHDDLKVVVNEDEIPITPFPYTIITSTIIGLISTLKGADDIKSFDVSVKAG